MTIQQTPEVTNYATVQSASGFLTFELLAQTEKASQSVYSRIKNEKKHLVSLRSKIQETSQLLDLTRREIKLAKSSAVSAGLSLLMSTGSLSSRDSV